LGRKIHQIFGKEGTVINDAKLHQKIERKNKNKNGCSTEHDTSQEYVRKLDQPFQHNRNSTADDEKNKMHTKTPWPGKKLWINPRLYSVNSKII
jgi:hypothetical protein